VTIHYLSIRTAWGGLPGEDVGLVNVGRLDFYILYLDQFQLIFSQTKRLVAIERSRMPQVLNAVYSSLWAKLLLDMTVFLLLFMFWSPLNDTDINGYKGMEIVIFCYSMHRPSFKCYIYHCVNLGNQ
jgi:hypothetical protein